MVLEGQPYLFAFTLGKFGALFALFGPLGAIFGVEVRLKNIFGTYLHRITTFIQSRHVVIKVSKIVTE